MHPKVKQALEVTLSNWQAMSKSDSEEAESSANEFEASFYIFIDAVREWFNSLEQYPQTIDEFLTLPMIEHILDLLPAPLYLNFETEAELILEHKTRIEDAKYD
ncbi:hypothetical protein EHS13_24420 [Paenibacillus psychroresistens]|uniref:Uncharacterized protein n=1 Tax=Paenibacillus psychroresistens TaxID=1778678 RepID=A0A6B8RP60_9BACL|nr:hypothetical protein [Paenibacillus psychroresistens]QGQ97809.1 hypothetical protein EHS13_24420 [Paenibacillus psychroresistens]